MKKKEHIDYINELHFCGCNLPELAYKALHNYLRNVKRMHEELEKTTNWEETRKVKGALGDSENEELYGLKEILAYTLDHLGFLNHGSSIGGAWLEDKGKVLLEALDILEKEYDYDYCEMYNDYIDEGIIY